MSAMVPDDAPRPRLCLIRKWDDFPGFGFNLHAEKGKAGQFIGKVDADSPADAAGLKENDRIIEVNGTNISNENHKQVVERIKAFPDKTTMLVLDRDAEEYYRDLKIVVRSDMPNVLSLSTPAVMGAVVHSEHVEDVREHVEADRHSHNSDRSSRSSHSDHPVQVDRISQSSDSHPHRARLCVIRLWDDFQGYGFNLHSEKNKSGQFIGKVDEGSPAEAAGMRENDHILSVNDEDVRGDNHQAVVAKIKSVPGVTRMLVVTHEAADYFRDRGIEVHSSSSFVDVLECPEHHATVISRPAVSTPPRERDAHPHRARSVQLCTWSNYDGYGFNMHSVKGKPGEYIGKVEVGSPASVAGLKEGDRLIEVNGDNVEQDGHNEVVQRIKNADGRARLLVVDPVADEFFREHNTAINASMSNVVIVHCPEFKPQENGVGESSQHAQSYIEEPEEEEVPPAYNHVSSREEDTERFNNYENEATEAEEPYNNNEKLDDDFVTTTTTTRVEETIIERAPTPEPVRVPTPEPQPVRESSPPPVWGAPEVKTTEVTVVRRDHDRPSSPPVSLAGLHFAGSVEEARRRVSKKRDTRHDPTSLSAKQKYDLFQKL